MQKIGSTGNEQDLLSLTREYLAHWYHGDLAEIAEECRPTRVRDVGDLHYWSERLAEGFCKEGVHGSRPDLHREMLTFFTEAAKRANGLLTLSPALPQGGGKISAAPASPARRERDLSR